MRARPLTLLVANRGEIAIRAFRAAVELGLATVAIYTHLDRGSLHRIKADRAFEVGPPERPLAGYLDPDAIVACALKVGADAIYPGYGFLSESAVFAQKVDRRRAAVGRAARRRAGPHGGQGAGPRRGVGRRPAGARGLAAGRDPRGGAVARPSAWATRSS